MQAHHEERAEQHLRVATRETGRGDDHDQDLERLDPADQACLVVLVGELPRRRGEQEERQDEQACGEVHHHARGEPGEPHRLEGHEDDDGVLEDVVVERTEELGDEERREAPLAKQAELTAVGHGRVRVEGERREFSCAFGREGHDRGSLMVAVPALRSSVPAVVRLLASLEARLGVPLIRRNMRCASR